MQQQRASKFDCSDKNSDFILVLCAFSTITITEIAAIVQFKSEAGIIDSSVASNAKFIDYLVFSD